MASTSFFERAVSWEVLFVEVDFVGMLIELSWCRSETYFADEGENAFYSKQVFVFFLGLDSKRQNFVNVAGKIIKSDEKL